MTREEMLLNFLESDFGQSGRDVLLEMIRCEFQLMEEEIAKLKNSIENLKDDIRDLVE